VVLLSSLTSGSMVHWPHADLSIEGVYVDGGSIQVLLIDRDVLDAESRVAVYLPFLYVALYISVLLNC